MDTESRVEIDTREVAEKLSFLVGRTVLFRDGHQDACTATSVLAVRAANTPGVDGHPQVDICTTVGIRTITRSSEFNDIVLLDGKTLGKYADGMGISF